MSRNKSDAEKTLKKFAPILLLVLLTSVFLNDTPLALCANAPYVSPPIPWDLESIQHYLTVSVHDADEVKNFSINLRFVENRLMGHSRGNSPLDLDCLLFMGHWLHENQDLALESARLMSQA